MLTNVTNKTLVEIGYVLNRLYIYRTQNKRTRDMAISNMHETLLLYTKQKSMVNNKLSTTMMNMLNASKQTAES